MQYQVPQFIEVEDKIFGPLTIKQFIYLAGGGGLCLMFYSILPLYLTILLTVPVLAFSLALAFYHINGRPFVVAIEHAFYYYLGAKLYLWKQRPPKPAPQAQVPTPHTPTMPVPTLTEGRLKDLAWSLNIKDRATMGVTNKEPSGFEL